MLMRAIDRRLFLPGQNRPVFLWQDEAHQFSIDQDAAFQSGARSKGLAAVRIDQGLPAYLDSFGKDGRHKVDALLGSHATKFFHRNDCPVTNKWASELIAKDTVFRLSLSSSRTAAPRTRGLLNRSCFNPAGYSMGVRDGSLDALANFKIK
jgi:hypothetical protein